MCNVRIKRRKSADVVAAKADRLDVNIRGALTLASRNNVVEYIVFRVYLDPSFPRSTHARVSPPSPTLPPPLPFGSNRKRNR